MKFVTVLLIFFSLGMRAQPSAQAVSGRLDALSAMQPHRSIPELGFDYRSGTVRGTPYLTDTWLEGGIHFAGDSAYTHKLTVRFNLLEQALEVLSKNGVKVAYASDIEGFYLQEGTRQRHFVAGRSLKEEGGTPLTGFYELLQQGTYLHLRHHSAYGKRPDYKEAFHTGSLDYQIIPTQKDYVADRGVLYPVKAFINSRRKSDADFRKFINRNNLSVKEASDLSSMLHYLNRGGE